MSVRRVEDIWHEAQEPTPTPEYVEGALYLVYATDADPIAMWRTTGGWLTDPSGTRFYRDVTWPIDSAERIWTFNPATQVVIAKDGGWWDRDGTIWSWSGLVSAVERALREQEAQR